ncbi:hypothetical protein [Arthrobacter caoxuetaonis]|uniref:hypothetical protein n=1 Tax=Arthrobacter caoxuetaonis TaxID=2886935 RepID=UPI001D158D3F|nr:hypothetical protein [Arthrobacter caoxuetaonis]MCC3283474.1 hypothetical protein [Arthrobacter caoxuetaonis]
MAPSTRYDIASRPRRGAAPPNAPTWRRVTSAILGVLAALLLIASVTAGYAGSLAANTDRYVATVGPVIHDPAVQADLSGQISEQVTSRLDVSTSVNDALSGIDDSRASQALAAAVAPVVADRTNALIDNTVAKAVASPAFATLWTDANRRAHEVLVRAVQDDPGGVAAIAPNGDITVSTAAMIGEVKSRLLAQGVSAATVIPDDAGQDYTVFNAPGLASSLSALNTLGTVASVLPWLAAAAAAAAVLTAPNGRRLRSGLVIAVSGAAAGLAAVLVLRVLQQAGIDSVTGSALSPDAAAALKGAFLDPLAAALRTVVVLSVLAVLVLYAAGHTSRWEPWALRHQRVCQAVAAGITVLVLFLPGLTAGTTIGIALVMVGVIVVLEVLGRRSRTPLAAASGNGPAAAG